jgi:hypothetical protein
MTQPSDSAGGGGGFIFFGSERTDACSLGANAGRAGTQPDPLFPREFGAFPPWTEVTAANHIGHIFAGRFLLDAGALVRPPTDAGASEDAGSEFDAGAPGGTDAVDALPPQFSVACSCQAGTEALPLGLFLLAQARSDRRFAKKRRNARTDEKSSR